MDDCAAKGFIIDDKMKEGNYSTHDKLLSLH